MKKVILVLCIFSINIKGRAQNVGIGTQTPEASALLDVSSTTKGFIPPRMTSGQRTSITSPATGLLVYDIEANNFYFYDGSTWVQAVGPTGSTGPAGAPGSAILSGTTVPSSGLGTNGDFYPRTTNSQFYGPKTGGGWGSGVSLVGSAGTTGTNGTDGKTILSGSLNPPSAGTGSNGDFYLNTISKTLFGPKVSGSWPAGVSLIGPAGPTGPAGGTNNFSITYNYPTGLEIPKSTSWTMTAAKSLALSTAGVLVNVVVSISTALLSNQSVECNICYSTSQTIGPFTPITFVGNDIELTHRLGTVYQTITLVGKVIPSSAGVYWVGPCFKSPSDNLVLKEAMGYGIILD